MNKKLQAWVALNCAKESNNMRLLKNTMEYNLVIMHTITVSQKSHNQRNVKNMIKSKYNKDITKLLPVCR